MITINSVSSLLKCVQVCQSQIPELVDYQIQIQIEKMLNQQRAFSQQRALSQKRAFS